MNKYKWNAEDYSKNSSAQQKWARELIEKLQLDGSEKLLDIGCGDGKVTAEIANYLVSGKVTGIDNSKEMLALATKKFCNGNYPNLNFQRMDASNISFHQKFDVVFSNAALHWVTNHEPVLRGIFASLKTPGRVLVQMGGKGNVAQVIEVVEKIIKEKQWVEYFKDFSFPYGFYSPQEYEPWLIKAGFKVEYVSLIPKDMVHENLEKFRGWFRTTWLPYINSVPSGKREEFIETIIENYIETNPPNHEGKIINKMQRLEFQACK
ncbi:class I SAM-dependent methyltransferase [Desulfobacterota bacterium M19]